MALTLADIYKAVNPNDPSLTGVLPTGAIIAGGVLGHNAAGNASNTLQAGLADAQGTIQNAGTRLSDVSKGVYDDQLGYMKPYADLGADAVGQLQAGLKPGGGLTDPFKFDTGDLYRDPSYQFNLEQVNKQNLASLGRQGLDYSGGVARQLAQYTGNLANQLYDTTYKRSENTFNTNKQQRLSALQDATGRGQSAANTDVSAAANYGDKMQNGIQWTATQLADLQAQKADALASGDLAKSKTITDMIAGAANQINSNGSPVMAALKKLLPGGGGTPGVPNLSQVGPQLGPQVPPGFEGPNIGNPGGSIGYVPGAPAGNYGNVLPIDAPSAATPPPSSLADLGKVTGTAVTGTAAAGSAPLTGYAGGGLITSHGAAIGMLTNPITIGIGAAILATTAILKSQAHWEANTITKKFQAPFDDQMKQISDQFAQLKQSGQLTPQDAQQTQQAVQGLAQAYLQKLDEYAGKGKDYKTVTDQAKATFAKWYTPQFFAQFAA